jgi:hypothetical protein
LTQFFFEPSVDVQLFSKEENMSLLREHLKYYDFLKIGDLAGAKAQMTASNFTFKDLCNPDLKHCLTNPVYGTIQGMLGVKTELKGEWREYIKTIVEAAPQMLDIVTNRVNVLSYLVMNTDEPGLVQFFIDKRPSLLNDQSDYTKNQTNEYTSTFKMYNPNFNSPVHEAVMGNRLNSLDVLVKNGANVNLKNIVNVKPMDQYFINCYKLDGSIPSKLAAVGGDVTFTGSTSYLQSGINNKCWAGLNKVLPTSKSPMNVFQFNDIINKATNTTGAVDKEAVKTAYLSLSHLAKDFDVKKYGEVNCLKQPIANSENCKKVIAAVIDMQHENVLHTSVAEHHSDL